MIRAVVFETDCVEVRIDRRQQSETPPSTHPRTCQQKAFKVHPTLLTYVLQLQLTSTTSKAEISIKVRQASAFHQQQQQHPSPCILLAPNAALPSPAVANRALLAERVARSRKPKLMRGYYGVVGWFYQTGYCI
ncbi:hypothetical protein BST61_g1327 [Cercospora zeina]